MSTVRLYYSAYVWHISWFLHDYKIPSISLSSQASNGEASLQQLRDKHLCLCRSCWCMMTLTISIDIFLGVIISIDNLARMDSSIVLNLHLCINLKISWESCICETGKFKPDNHQNRCKNHSTKIKASEIFQFYGFIGLLTWWTISILQGSRAQVLPWAVYSLRYLLGDKIIYDPYIFCFQ